MSEPKTNELTQSDNSPQGKEVAALVLGILSLIVPYVGFVLGIISIVFAKGAMNKPRDSKGRGMAIAGLVCGIIGCSIYGLLLLFSLLALLTASAFRF